MGMGVILESNLLAGGHVRQGQLTPVFADEQEHAGRRAPLRPAPR